MPHTYVQADRPLVVSANTPDPDDLLLVGFSGHEAVSQLFAFQLDLLAENATAVRFEELLGQRVTVHLSKIDGTRRHFSGICKAISEGTRDLTFTSYRMEVVPALWLLTRRAQSRIFQQVSVPEVLKEVLSGLDVAFEIDGTFLPRDYCVQYRETDFNFASRLMEEEGIYYFFRHSEKGHTLVLANTPDRHPDLPGRKGSVTYGGSELGVQGEDRVGAWEKTQGLRSGRFTLRDYCFEVPQQTLEAGATIADSVAAGKVTHKLRVGHNDRLELYDFPGEYAQRFDGVNPGGGDRSADLDHLFTDNQRTVDIRMQEEAAAGLTVQGAGTCRDFISGHRFTLSGHFNADGPYVLTAVEHSALDVDAYRSGASGGFVYNNTFTCIPLALPFRPPRRTPKPFVQGTQTAVVVGPSGEEIFTDKYGRVKVQFFWDRGGSKDANSSCWVRVGTPWAGPRWGMIHIPRIGQEVVVDFLEGDPDQPLIIGSVYNADMMPPYELPKHKTQSGVKSRSTPKGQPSNFNEIRFEDLKGNEQVYVQAERNLDTLVKADATLTVGGDRAKSVGRDETIKIGRDESITIDGSLSEEVAKDAYFQVGGNRTEEVQKDQTLEVSGKILIAAGPSIRLECGAASIEMKRDGTITIQGTQITIKGLNGSVTVDASGVAAKGLMFQAEGEVLSKLKGLMTQINADAMLTTQAAITMMS